MIVLTEQFAMNRFLRCSLALTVALVLTGLGNLAAEAAESNALPQVRVASVRRVFHNGEHNAFTDLVRFQDTFYLTFRSCPDGHMVHPTASIIILASKDAQEWEQVHRFHVEQRDTRDPHFLIFRDKLFVDTGTWYSGATTLPRDDYDLNKHLGYAAWSDDGTTWHSPILLEGTFGHYVWRAAALGDKAYLCGRRKVGFAVAPQRADLIRSAPLTVTFNGRRFDIPFLRHRFPTIPEPKAHIDLLHIARGAGFQGGQKHVEEQLGLQRDEAVRGVDGPEAVACWCRALYGDGESYRQLLAYNRADVELMPEIASRPCDTLRRKTLPSPEPPAAPRSMTTTIGRRAPLFSALQRSWKERRPGLHQLEPRLIARFSRPPVVVGIDLRAKAPQDLALHEALGEGQLAPEPLVRDLVREAVQLTTGAYIPPQYHDLRAYPIAREPLPPLAALAIFS